jgi:hypothetical protein
MKRLTMASRAYHEEEEDTTCTKTRRDLLVWTTRADRSEQITRKPISIPVRDARADLLNLKLLIKKDRKMMTSLCDRPAVLDPRSNSLVEHNSSSSQSRLIIIYSKKNKKLAAEDDVGSPPDTFWQKTIRHHHSIRRHTKRMRCDANQAQQQKKYSEELIRNSEVGADQKGNSEFRTLVSKNQALKFTARFVKSARPVGRSRGNTIALPSPPTPNKQINKELCLNNYKKKVALKQGISSPPEPPPLHLRLV